MKRHLYTGLLLAALVGLSACSHTGERSNSGSLIQVSSVQWDVVAAADTAAQVNNNSLIVMR